jgi:hypothetical protein
MEATMNKLQKLLIAGLVAGSFGSVAAPAMADTVIIRQAPPAPRNEPIPQARRGYVWAPGHWDYRHGRYVWTRGTWLRERHGYAYNAPTWVERDGRWVMERGGWRRGDRDGDGVRNGRDHDRDGDGIPNRMDARPNNPNRG